MEFKFKLLGFPIQFRLEVVIAAILVGMFIQANMLCNCITQEGMESIENVLGIQLKNNNLF